MVEIMINLLQARCSVLIIGLLHPEIAKLIIVNV